MSCCCGYRAAHFSRLRTTVIVLFTSLALVRGEETLFLVDVWNCMVRLTVGTNLQRLLTFLNLRYSQYDLSLFHHISRLCETRQKYRQKDIKVNKGQTDRRHSTANNFS